MSGPEESPNARGEEPRVIGDRYQVIRMLGEGSSARTLLCADLHDERRVAVKELHFQHLEDWKYLELFEREAKVLSLLDHRGIPKILDFFQGPGASTTLYIVQEFIEGASLKQRMESGPMLGQQEVHDLALGLLDVLEYLHGRAPPVLHRDIKPSNVLARPEGDAALGDFGGVCFGWRPPDQAGATVVGTFGYMPPEQLLGQGGPTSDLYALGATLLHVVTGKPPSEFPFDSGRIEVPTDLPAGDSLTRLIEALLRSMTPQSWYLRRLKNHIIVSGDGELAISTLRVLRRHHPKVPVVVVSSNPEQLVVDEFNQDFGATVVTGDITHEFFLKQLRVESARRVLLLDENSLRSYEAASSLINLVPGIGDRVIIHCGNLRFMRAMENTRVAQRCQTFNAYHLAAAGLVRSHMLHHFRETHAKDVVILAGFGRFGQTILEELQRCAIEELDTVIIMDIDAHRRVMIADEHIAFSGKYKRELFEGDISHPEVWERLGRETDIDGDNTVFVLGTGREEENLRTALWLRQKYPGAMIIARSAKESLFATEVGREHDIVSISISQLVEDNIPRSWVTVD